jgi:hypothetical protein
MFMRTRALLFGLLLLAMPAAAGAQNFGIEGIDRYLRLEWEASQGRRGPVLAGYVHNIYGHTADRVRVMIEGLDAGGQVTSTSQTQVMGQIDPGGRGYFEVPAPRGAASYRLRVISFDPIGRGV